MRDGTPPRAARLPTLVALVFLAGCSARPATGIASDAGPSTVAVVAVGSADDAGASPSPSAAVASARSPNVEAPEPPDPRDVPPSFETVAAALFLGATERSAACGPSIPADARIRCLYDERYRGDAKAASLAHELLVKWNIVAGVEAPHAIDGGFRGAIRLEPAVPIGADRKHLEWIVAAMRDFDAFFRDLAAGASTSSAPSRADENPGGATPPRTRPYRFRGITLRFVRSVGRTTPSAYAHDWTIGWNLAGSLHTSETAVRETLFHEIFHLNDGARGSWSPRALRADYQPILDRCKASSSCLAPFAPNDTMVRGGTYYAFQQGNGDSVLEYGAELALRYYREQRAHLRSLPAPKAFKCGPAPNAKVWRAMGVEFFAGIDRVPACPE